MRKFARLSVPLVASLIGLGCADLLVEPAVAPRAFLTVKRAATEGPAPSGLALVFDRVDEITVRVADEETDAELWNGPVGFLQLPLGLQLDPIDVVLPDDDLDVTVEVMLRVAGIDVFRGSLDMKIDVGHPSTSAAIEVDPILDQVVVDPVPVLEVIGATIQAVAGVRFATGDAVSGIPLSWVSDQPDIVAVDASTGLLTARREGQARLTASAGALVTAFDVSVRIPLDRVVVVPGAAELEVGEELVFSAVALSVSGESLERDFAWTSADPAVARVDPTGRVTAIAPGTTSVTAEADGVSASATVRVFATQNDVTTLAATDVSQTEATIHGTASAPGGTTWFEWGGASDPATMTNRAPDAPPNSNGDFQARLSGLTPSQPYFFRAAQVIAADTTYGTVRSFQTPSPLPVASVSIVTPGGPLELGESIALQFIALNALGQAVTPTAVEWTSSNSAAVRVYPTGLIEARSAGSAVIQVTADGVSDDVLITVPDPDPEPDPGPPVVQVVVTPTDGRMRLGDSLQLQAEALDSAGASMSVAITWSSSDASVVTVNSQGLVTTAGEGSATLTATVDGVQNSATLTVMGAPGPVAADGATLVGPTTAVLNGSFSGQQLGATGWFEYSAQPNLGAATITSAQLLVPLFGSGAFSHLILSGLQPGTTYYYRAMVRTKAGPVIASEIRSFTTLGN